MGTKIYVGNISFGTTEADLKQLFSEIGEVLSVNLITDQASGRMKGFGFIEMASEDATNEAIAKLNGMVFKDRTLSVAEAKPMQPRENRGRSGDRRGGFRGRDGYGRGRR